MKRLVITASLAVLLCFIGIGAAAAEDASGDLDHLVCYRMKDSMSAPARFDLLARLQPQFSRAGCELVLDKDDEANAQFCVPASKRNVTAADHDPNIAGAPLSDDYVCYRIECPAGARPPDHVVADQFGTRSARFGQPKTICVPATKQPVGCGQTGTNSKGKASCGGVCPQGRACQLNKATNTCGCAPAPCGGKSDDAAVCGGSCANPADECVAGADNRCGCAPRGCGVDAAGQCGGACPDGLICGSATGGGCDCVQPPQGGCALDPEFGFCGGDCADGLFCLPPVGGGEFCVCRNFGGFE